MALKYCSINNGSPTDACDDGNGGRMQCQIASSSVGGFNLNANENRFKTSTSWSSISDCATLTQQSAVQNMWGRLSIYSGCVGTFSNANMEYRFRSMELGNNTRLMLAQGDYWLETLQLNQGAQLYVQGNSRIFISNNAELNGATINVASGGQLTIVPITA